MLEIADYESQNNLLLIEEDYVTKKVYVTLLYCPNMIKKWNMEHVSKKLLKYQQEYYEEYFVPMQLERSIYSNISNQNEFREFNKFSKQDFMNIYKRFSFEVNINNGMIGSYVSDDIYEELSFKKFDYFQVDSRVKKVNKKEYIILKNEKILKTGEENIYRPLFSFKNNKIKTNIPNTIREVFKMYFEELVDYIMMWVSDIDKERKIKREMIMDYIKDIKEELENPQNDIIYRIKNHQLTLKNEFKYINEKNKNEKKLSNLNKIVIETDKVKFLKDS